MDRDTVSIYVSVIALLISAGGWFVVHLLALRTQKLSLINSLMNEARIELNGAIQTLLDCCTDIVAGLSAIQIVAESPVQMDVSTRIGRINEIRTRTMDGTTLAWVKLLEEYECLFPETADVRIKLMNRVSATLDNVQKILDHWQFGMELASDINVERCTNDLFDIISLGWDLRIYLQNRVIGEITGHFVRERQVTRPELPRIVLKQRKLVIDSGSPNNAH